MNSTTPSPEDPELRRILQQAHPTPALPPRFQESVWQRLERTEQRLEDASPRGWLERWMQSVLRPAFATSGLAAVMLAGLWLGFRATDGRVHQVEQARYVAAVSPFHRSLP